MNTETTTYDHHDKAFTNVSAYVITRNGERVATIALKFPKDGAGRLWAYVHWIGTPMVRGSAGGYGYDKRSAAVAKAIDAMRDGSLHKAASDLPADRILAFREFRDALSAVSGEYFDARLTAAGFDVWQAV